MIQHIDLLADREKSYFDNPIKNILDLFQYLSVVLGYEDKQPSEELAFQIAKLFVSFQREIQNENIR